MSKTASSLFITAALLVAVAAPAAAQKQAPAADSDHVKALIEEAKTRLAQGGQTPSPAQAATTTGPRVDLTADQAVARALERNVTLSQQRLTPQTYDYSLAATYAFYRPSLNSTVSTQSATTLARQTIEGGVRTNSDTAVWNAGIAQNMRWQGGNYQVNWTNNRIASNQNNNIFNPAYSAGFQAIYVQPILANRKFDQTRTNLLTTEIQQDISELDLQSTTASIVAQTRNAYWDFVFSILNVENQRASLDLSSKLVQDNRARVEIGTMAPIDIVQAQAEEATRRQALVNAEATRQNAELALKQLIVSGTDDPVWTSSLNPTDVPTPGEETIDLEAAVRNALANRTDLLTAKKNIDAANVQLRGLNNQTLPQLNLQGTYRLDGRGGTTTAGPEPFPPPTNWWNALGGIGNCRGADLDGADAILVSAGHERRRGKQGAPADHHPAEPDGGEGDRASDRDRRHCGVHRHPQLARSHQGGDRSARIVGQARRSGAEQARRRHGHQLRSRAGAARPRGRPQPGAARAPELSPRAHRLPAHADQPEVNADC